MFHTNSKMPPAPPVAPAADLKQRVKIRLSLPIEGHTGTISEIALREPTFGDWMECGDFHKSTVVRGADGEIAGMQLEIDTLSVAKWMQRLSGLQMAVLAQMGYADSKRVFEVLNRLVGDTTKGNSPPPLATSG